jgi:hypothetical protein
MDAWIDADNHNMCPQTMHRKNLAHFQARQECIARPGCKQCFFSRGPPARLCRKCKADDDALIVRLMKDLNLCTGRWHIGMTVYPVL